MEPDRKGESEEEQVSEDVDWYIELIGQDSSFIARSEPNED